MKEKMLNMMAQAKPLKDKIHKMMAEWTSFYPTLAPKAKQVILEKVIYAVFVLEKLEKFYEDNPKITFQEFSKWVSMYDKFYRSMMMGMTKLGLTESGYRPKKERQTRVETPQDVFKKITGAKNHNDK